MDLNLKLDNIMKTKGLTACRLFDDYSDNVVVFDKTELKDVKTVCNKLDKLNKDIQKVNFTTIFKEGD